MEYILMKLIDRSEFFIETKSSYDMDEIVRAEAGGFLKISQINIEEERFPVYINMANIASIQLINKSAVSPRTKLWSMEK